MPPPDKTKIDKQKTAKHIFTSNILGRFGGKKDAMVAVRLSTAKNSGAPG